MDKKELSELFNQCNRYIHHKRGKRMGQNRVLFHLYMHGDCSQKELQDFFRIQSGSMSELVLKLENNNHIIRYKNESDQRKFMLRITDTGKRIIEDIFEETKLEEEFLFGFLSDEECDKLGSILRKLIDKWEIKEEDLRPGRCK